MSSSKEGGRFSSFLTSSQYRKEFNVFRQVVQRCCAKFQSRKRLDPSDFRAIYDSYALLQFPLSFLQSPELTNIHDDLISILRNVNESCFEKIHEAIVDKVVHNLSLQKMSLSQDSLNFLLLHYLIITESISASNEIQNESVNSIRNTTVLLESFSKTTPDYELCKRICGVCIRTIHSLCHSSECRSQHMDIGVVFHRYIRNYSSLWGTVHNAELLQATHTSGTSPLCENDGSGQLDDCVWQNSSQELSERMVLSIRCLNSLIRYLLEHKYSDVNDDHPMERNRICDEMWVAFLCILRYLRTPEWSDPSILTCLCYALQGMNVLIPLTFTHVLSSFLWSDLFGILVDPLVSYQSLSDEQLCSNDISGLDVNGPMDAESIVSRVRIQSLQCIRLLLRQPQASLTDSQFIGLCSLSCSHIHSLTPKNTLCEVLSLLSALFSVELVSLNVCGNVCDDKDGEDAHLSGSLTVITPPPPSPPLSLVQPCRTVLKCVADLIFVQKGTELVESCRLLTVVVKSVLGHSCTQELLCILQLLLSVVFNRDGLPNVVTVNAWISLTQLFTPHTTCLHCEPVTHSLPLQASSSLTNSDCCLRRCVSEFLMDEQSSFTHSVIHEYPTIQYITGLSMVKSIIQFIRSSKSPFNCLKECAQCLCILITHFTQEIMSVHSVDIISLITHLSNQVSPECRIASSSLFSSILTCDFSSSSSPLLTSQPSHPLNISLVTNDSMETTFHTLLLSNTSSTIRSRLYRGLSSNTRFWPFLCPIQCMNELMDSILLDCDLVSSDSDILGNILKLLKELFANRFVEEFHSQFHTHTRSLLYRFTTHFSAYSITHQLRILHIIPSILRHVHYEISPIAVVDGLGTCDSEAIVTTTGASIPSPLSSMNDGKYIEGTVVNQLLQIIYTHCHTSHESLIDCVHCLVELIVVVSPHAFITSIIDLGLPIIVGVKSSMKSNEKSSVIHSLSSGDSESGTLSLCWSFLYRSISVVESIVGQSSTSDPQLLLTLDRLRHLFDRWVYSL